MKHAITIARVLLGLIFLIFAANYFVPFMPQPEMGEAGGAFIGALLASGYLFPFMKAVDLVAGALLVAGFAVPLALAVLAPIIVNIFLFHLFLEPAGLPLAVALVVLEVFLAWSYRGAFKEVLKLRTLSSVGE